jgi:hypothetical protein
MIELILLGIFLVLVLYLTTRLVNAIVQAIFRVVVAFVKLPRHVGVGAWRASLLARRCVRWCEEQYIAAERRARGV